METLSLELDYTLWRCGGNKISGPKTPGCELGRDVTRLMQVMPPEPHSCCCVGLMLRAAGVPDRNLVWQSTVASAVLHGVTEEAMPAVEALLACLDTEIEPSIRLSVAARAYRINDQADVAIPDRMSQITRLFADHGVQLTWTNVPDDVRTAAQL